MTDTSTCSNCLTPLQGSYCYECGQSAKGADRFFLTLVNEAFEDIFSMSSRVWKTLGNLLFRPGFLSTEYFAGRRVRYIPPVRLYFTLSILFFLVYSVFAFFNPDETAGVQIIEAREAVEQAASEEQDATEAKAERAAAEEEKEADADNTSELGDEDSNVKIDLPWLNEVEDKALQERIKIQVEKAQKTYLENPELVGEYFRDVAPPIIFCLLPLFALLLKLFYVFKGMYYTQHLILAVHVHCFVFLWLTLFTLIDFIALKFGGTPELIETIMGLWCAFYLWRSLRVVYGQGRFVTTLKYILLGFCYIILAAIAVFGALIFGIMTV